MKLPKKISPDSLINAIVEIRYTATIPFEILLGLIFKSLDNSFRYTNQPNQGTPLPENIQIPKEINISFVPQSIFYTDKIKLELKPNTFVFNFVSEYTGWKTYFEAIKDALVQISQVTEIQLFNRIGIRYISAYKQQKLKSITQFEFGFGLPKVTSNSSFFRSDFKDEEFIINLTLQDRVLMYFANQGGNQELSRASVVDIDVIVEGIEISEIEKLLKKVEEVHLKEKETFFSILHPEYLKTLTVEY